MKGKTICDMDCLNCVYPDCINDKVTPNYYQIMKANNPEAYRKRVDTIKAYVTTRYYARKEAGICVMCGKAKSVAGIYCETCAEKNRQYRRKSYKKRKEAV